MQRPDSILRPSPLPFEFDEISGDVSDGSIRYLLMRPDVLMGMFAKLEGDELINALSALEQSTRENGRASMLEYRKLNFGSQDEALRFFCQSAARLGWGRFDYEWNAAGLPVFKVANSPFVAGYGASDIGVCAPISGILGAFLQVFFDESMSVREVECAAQGGDDCRFEVCDESS